MMSQENWKCLHRYTTKLINDCSILLWWNIGNEHTSYSKMRRSHNRPYTINRLVQLILHKLLDCV